MRALWGFSVSAQVSGPGDFGAEDVGFFVRGLLSLG